MKQVVFLLFIILFKATQSTAQFEINTSFSNNGKGNVQGFGINLAYEIPIINNRFATKSQIGAKFLKSNHDFVDGTFKNIILEIHQTISYKLVNHTKYIFNPNIGLNYRYFDWEAKLNPPYNELPIRGSHIYFRDGSLSVHSVDGKFSDTYYVDNIGFTLQLQNRFKLKDNVWLLITPFIDDDYDGSQTVAGCYVGVFLYLK